MIFSVSETATIPVVKSLLMKKIMAAAKAGAEALMMRTSVTNVIYFSRINTSLFSAVAIVSLLFLVISQKFPSVPSFFRLQQNQRRNKIFRTLFL